MREEQASPSLIDLLTLCVCVGMSFNFVISCCRPLSVFMTGVTACDPAGLHHAKFFSMDFSAQSFSIDSSRSEELFITPPPPASRVKSLTHVSYRQLEAFDRWSTSMVCGRPWNSLSWVTSTNLEQKISVSKAPSDFKCKAISPRFSGCSLDGPTTNQSKGTSDTDQHMRAVEVLGFQVRGRTAVSSQISGSVSQTVQNVFVKTFEAVNLDAHSISAAWFDSFSGTDLRTGHKWTDLQPVRAAACSAGARKHLCPVELCNPVTRISFYQ